jgi:hypothetical protein
MLWHIQIKVHKFTLLCNNNAKNGWISWVYAKNNVKLDWTDFCNLCFRFQYVLAAATSIATKVNEETLTYLNQGQSYEIKLKKLGELSAYRGKILKVSIWGDWKMLFMCGVNTVVPIGRNVAVWMMPLYELGYLNHKVRTAARAGLCPWDNRGKSERLPPPNT